MNLTAGAQSPSQSPSADTQTSTPRSRRSDSQRASAANRKKSAEIADTKARRVRTGCLTCRERHLKCDETLGRCLNCRKSDRICRRGVRLNFIDIQTVAPPHIIDHPHGAQVTFRDDSRHIASEYVGGFERYPPPQPESPVEKTRQLDYDNFEIIGPDYLTNLFQTAAHSLDPLSFDLPHSTTPDLLAGVDTWHQHHLIPGDELLPQGTSNFARKLARKHDDHLCLTDSDQVIFLQAFVEKVGPWMDAMDESNHFTHILPLHASNEAMLLKAFLACGARHLSLVDLAYEDKAIHLFEATTHDLLVSMQDPNRDSVLCATTALILGVYEIMSQSAQQTNHIAGSRALIRECGWTASTPGLGSAIFWISIRMELLDCLYHKWALSWDPDTWGVNMDLSQVAPVGMTEEDLWSHRILYICAKIANFRISVDQSQTLDDQPSRTHEQFQEWSLYNDWCDRWDKNVPRSMMPLSHLHPWQTNSQSVFPQIWLVKPSGILARVLYHTARILLARAHPLESEFRSETRNMQTTNAYEVFGLVTRLKDRNVASVLTRCLAIAAESLDTREAQEEALGVLDKISTETRWESGSVKDGLKQTWGWGLSPPHTLAPAQMHNHFAPDPATSISEGPEVSTGTDNLLLITGDFSAENHPYQGYYVAPQHHVLHQYDGYLM
ncbi:transcriptional regulator family: Fungal Specific TF [Penicillium alfredii]|uniref:Transcriptional regulator family: Fungal Specific TF n=1 Tax=Penicillium alfredii TaxID=1506179 RepID=A0A9W9F1J4_9EURO|nr:transcriptional regulator family: Fungal Specific TF [Penicillium alfredii]KAJ5091902.1 transcriptional regulator family: Fungal Specific TF [Penicillium alfredii]